MSAPPLRAYATSGLVLVEVVDALLAFGEPMLTEYPPIRMAPDPLYRAWMRLRSGGRTFGRLDLSPQFAAERLLAKLEERR